MWIRDWKTKENDVVFSPWRLCRRNGLLLTVPATPSDRFTSMCATVEFINAYGPKSASSRPL
jgi:hypothetical protein